MQQIFWHHALAKLTYNSARKTRPKKKKFKTGKKVEMRRSLTLNWAPFLHTVKKKIKKNKNKCSVRNQKEKHNETCVSYFLHEWPHTVWYDEFPMYNSTQLEILSGYGSATPWKELTSLLFLSFLFIFNSAETTPF